MGESMDENNEDRLESLTSFQKSCSTLVIEIANGVYDEAEIRRRAIDLRNEGVREGHAQK